MKLKTIQISKFRRFESLCLDNIPPAKLIILAGPNGSGKSSLFDAFSAWQQAQYFGLHWDASYYNRDRSGSNWNNQVTPTFHDGTPSNKTFYLRSAYRNDPEFEIHSLQKLADAASAIRVRRMIEQDGAVSQNYQRLASDAFQDAFDTYDETKTLREFRESSIGEISRAVNSLFPHLELNTLGNPLTEGTFRFTKGAMKGFSYKNLSGGEKSAFDLLLDMLVKRRTFDDTIYAIDEPEAHMNTRLQGALLGELYKFIPDNSQIWIATHSIGMMRKAKELYDQNPGEVIFYDFEGHDFDVPVTIRPTRPDRSFWQRILRVALDDLADLVAPHEVIICEGNPKGHVPGKNEAHDARCYNIIFAEEYPDTMFISAGNSREVSGDRLRFASVLPSVIKGISVRRLIDRDDHSASDAAEMKRDGIETLSRRHIESYLYADDVIQALYDQHNRSVDAAAFIIRKAGYLSDANATRNRPLDDVKASAPQMYQDLKRDLNLTACGNDDLAFARNVLAPLLRPGMPTYVELRQDIFSEQSLGRI